MGGRERMTCLTVRVVDLLGGIEEKLEAMRNKYAPPTSSKMLPRKSCRSLLSLSYASQFQLPKKDFEAHLEVFH